MGSIKFCGWKIFHIFRSTDYLKHSRPETLGQFNILNITVCGLLYQVAITERNVFWTVGMLWSTIQTILVLSAPMRTPRARFQMVIMVSILFCRKKQPTFIATANFTMAGNVTLLWLKWTLCGRWIKWSPRWPVPVEMYDPNIDDWPVPEWDELTIVMQVILFCWIIKYLQPFIWWLVINFNLLYNHECVLNGNYTSLVDQIHMVKRLKIDALIPIQQSPDSCAPLNI